MTNNPINQPALYMGIDGGGSKCKACIVDVNNKVLGTGIAGPANAFIDQQQSIHSIINSAKLALVDANLAESDITRLTAGIGLAGVNLPSIYEEMSKWKHPFAKMFLTTDLHIACLGAHQGKDGAIIISGTGSCGYSFVDGKQVIIGGHGFPHGDKGSGAWLGLKGVKTVLLSLEGMAIKSTKIC